MTELTERPAHLDKPWTAREVLFALYNHLTGQSWALITEVSLTPDVSWQERAAAYGSRDVARIEQHKTRRIDMLGIRRSRKNIGELETLAIEVKVTREDFLSDVRNPAKQAEWRELSDRHVYAVPEGLVTPDEVPEGSGLLTISRYAQSAVTPGRVQWAKRAPRKPEPTPLPTWLTLAFMYRAASAEAMKKGLTWSGSQLGDDPEELRAEIQRLTAELARAKGKADRATDLVESWREVAGHAAGVACSTCGKPIAPRRPTAGTWKQWAHKKADEAACAPLRAAAHDAALRAEHAENSWGRPLEDFLRYRAVPGPRPAALFGEDEN